MDTNTKIALAIAVVVFAIFAIPALMISAMSRS